MRLVPGGWIMLLRILIILIVAFCASACVDETPEAVSSRGTVVFNSLEGGFFGIMDDEGRFWDPENLPDSLAIDSLRVSFRGVPTDNPSFHMVGRTINLTEVKEIGAPPPVDLEPFRALARNASCADVRNRLFLIDARVVFWDQESRCSDAAYNFTLYGRTTRHVICFSRDSIAGPQDWCSHTAGQYKNEFSVIVDNLDQPDLGLGPGRVEPIDF